MAACILVIVAILGWSGLVRAQAGATLRLVSPADGGYVSGGVLLKAELEPASATIEKVSFFADGQLVCTLQRQPFECPWDAGASVREHTIRAVAYLTDGTRLARSNRTRDAGFTERVDVEVVHVAASVMDGRGRFVRGLTQDSFKVFEDDEQRRITFFAAESMPLEVVVAVDASQSMVAAMPRVKAAVKKFLSELGEADRVTLLAFNDNVFTLARPEVDAAARLRAIDRLSAWGNTALYDAIVRAHDMLGRQRGRRAIVVFTDGEDKASRQTLEMVQRQVEASDVSLYMIGQGRGTELRQLKEILERLADISGGRAFFTQRIEELEEAFRQITEELSNQYLLSYVPTKPERDEEWRRIRVELREGMHRVRARQGYRLTRAPSPERQEP